MYLVCAHKMLVLFLYFVTDEIHRLRGITIELESIQKILMCADRWCKNELLYMKGIALSIAQTRRSTADRGHRRGLLESVNRETRSMQTEMQLNLFHFELCFSVVARKY